MSEVFSHVSNAASSQALVFQLKLLPDISCNGPTTKARRLKINWCSVSQSDKALSESRNKLNQPVPDLQQATLRGGDLGAAAAQHIHLAQAQL